MASKTCFKCEIKKDLNLFYKHAQMGDGHLNKCIECTKKDVTKNRGENIDYYRDYDRVRGSRMTSESLRQYREKFPKKYSATQMVGRAIRSGKLHSQDCEICGNKIGNHAHHDDYAKPLNVRWLCPAHHQEWHKTNKSINGD
jgi:hypothetical protein